MTEATWGEFFDFREFERKFMNACEIIASLEAKVASLEASINQINFTHVAPPGAYIPRNYRGFGV